MSDRLTLAHALEDGGVPRGAAEKIAHEIYEAIHDNVATKQDLERLETALKADIAAVRTEISAIRGDIRTEISTVRTDMATLEQRLLIRLGGLIVVVAGLASTIVHFWR